MSSPFQKQFSSKSPLHGAYSSGADAMVTVSDAPHYKKLQNDILGATLAALPTQEEKGEAQVRRAERRDARELAGGSKVKKFLDKNKLGFLTADYKKDSNKDGTTDYKDKTAKIKAKGEENITKGSAESEEAFNRKQASICSRKVGYKGWDPVSGTCIPE